MKTAGLIAVICCLFSNAAAQPKKKSSQSGKVTIVFRNLIHGKPAALNDSLYTNPFGENYSLGKLKYYVSGLQFYTSGKTIQKNYYYLVNQAIDSSLFFTLSLPGNKYDSIGFLLGVDSARNTSGAQTGALDPLNDMFWTWRTGYVMEKLEGTSPQSSLVNNKWEYHIGGFSGENSALRYITLSFPPNKKLHITPTGRGIIVIDADIDKFWNAVTDIQIKDLPACTTPGPAAKKISGNFCKLFVIADVLNNQ